MAQAWRWWGIPEFSTRFLSLSLSLIFNFCSATKPHLSFFLKIMFNFLSLQHYTPCVIGVGWGEVSQGGWISLFPIGRGAVNCFYVV